MACVEFYISSTQGQQMHCWVGNLTEIPGKNNKNMHWHRSSKNWNNKQQQQQHERTLNKCKLQLIWNFKQFEKQQKMPKTNAKPEIPSWSLESVPRSRSWSRNRSQRRRRRRRQWRRLRHVALWLNWMRNVDVKVAVELGKWQMRTVVGCQT